MVSTCTLALDDDEQRPFVPLGVEHADDSRHLHLQSHKGENSEHATPHHESTIAMSKASYPGVSDGDVLQVNARDPLPTTLDHICSNITRREGPFLVPASASNNTCTGF